MFIAARARRKTGLKAGFPRFKKYSRYKSITYPQHGFKIEGNRLKLSKIGDIQIRLHREIQGRIKTLTVKRFPSGKWYACFSCRVEAQPKDKPFEDMGIDVGLNSYAVLSNGTIIDNPRPYRKSEKRLAHLQKRMSQKKRGSARIRIRFFLTEVHKPEPDLHPLLMRGRSCARRTNTFLYIKNKVNLST